MSDESTFRPRGGHQPGSGQSSSEDPDKEIGLPQGKLFSLNSRRLIAAYLRHIAGALGLPSSGSADEVRQLIEGKIQSSREEGSVQVVVAEAFVKEVKLSLVDDSGVFLEMEPLRLRKEVAEQNELELAHSHQEGHRKGTGSAQDQAIHAHSHPQCHRGKANSAQDQEDHAHSAEECHRAEAGLAQDQEDPIDPSEARH